MKCENCGGKGTVGFLKRQCAVCGGAGYIEVKKTGREPYRATSYAIVDEFIPRSSDSLSDSSWSSDSPSSDSGSSDSSSSDSGSSDSGGGCGD